jgi:CHAT domain-containing protein
MKKIGPILCCLLFLGNLTCFTSSILAQDEPLETFVTVQSRRDALMGLLAEQNQLEETGDQVALVKVTNQIAQLHLKLFEFDAAFAAVNRSLVTARQIASDGEASLLVDTLILSGVTYNRHSESQKALGPLAEALKLSSGLKYSDGEAQSRAQIAVAKYELGKHLEAEQINKQALQIWQEHPNKRGEAGAQTTQGEIYMVLDRVAESDAALKSAEALWRSLNDTAELSNNLVDQNFLAIRQGQWQAALRLLNEADSLLVEKEAEPYLAGKIATSFGEVYEAYGLLDTALDYFREAQTLYRDAAHDKRATIDASTLVGRLKARLNDYSGAKEEIAQALTTAVALNNDLNIGLCHQDLGQILLEENSYETARVEFQSAIAYFTKSDSQRELARSRIYLGQTEYLLGNLTASQAAYNNALRFFEKTPDYTNEAALQFGLSKVAFRLRQLEKAEAHLERSLALTTRLRENASSKELRSSFLDSVHDRYETHVELLMARHAKQPDRQLEIQAFEASESGRALALLDAIRDQGRELRRPSDPLLFAEEERLQKQEQTLDDSIADLVSRGAPAGERAKVHQELTETRSRYETLQARMNTSPKFTDLLWPKPDYENIKNQLIDSQTSLLEYALGDKDSFAWVITQDGLKTTKLADKKTIDAAVTNLVQLLQKVPIDNTEDSKLQDAINEVSRLVLQPLSDQLRTPRLIVVADGALQNVPFQVLKAFPTANDPLVAQFDIIDAPSASALVTVRQERMQRQSGTRTLVGFGDAVFSADYPPGSASSNAPSLSNSRSDASRNAKTLPRLFYAQRELRAISDLAGKESALYVEYSATRDNLLKVDLSQFRILHVATHGVVNDAEPELSGFYLSLVDANHQPVNGFVSLADIYKLNAPVDLVVLSACQTSLGKNQRGEGLVGLTRGFMYAGAASVVASLWQVDDEVTAELMKYFYSYMLRDGMTPSAALRAAQNQIRSQSKWNAPYFWAGFTIQGDPSVNLKARAPSASRRWLATLVGVTLLVLLIGIGYWNLRRRMRRKASTAH